MVLRIYQMLFSVRRQELPAVAARADTAYLRDRNFVVSTNLRRQAVLGGKPLTNKTGEAGVIFGGRWSTRAPIAAVGVSSGPGCRADCKWITCCHDLLFSIRLSPSVPGAPVDAVAFTHYVAIDFAGTFSGQPVVVH